MSETELHYGKLLKLQLPEGITVETACKEACTRLGDSDILDSGYKCWVDQLKYGHSDKYFVYDGEIYGILNHYRSTDEDSYMKLYESEGSHVIDFIGSFYNGGTYFEEMLGNAIDKLNKKNDGNS